jgi:4-diphosphocytidyl-2-C-methyl-D-erythritol kinase
LRERAGVRSGLKLVLEKRIPAESGLGGGSSDAAATLLAANDAWQLGWDRARLMPLAAELGSDVPFFLLGGAAAVRGRGERLEPAAALGHLSFVIVRPPEGLSTAEVYRACRPSTAPRGVGPLIDALRRGRFGQLPHELHNVLETAAATVSLCVGRVRHALGAMGQCAVRMSGSGSAFFAICRHRREARRVAECLASRGLGIVKAVDICN